MELYKKYDVKKGLNVINFLRRRQKKIFCISFQRTGTRSTGQFFKDHGYRVSTWQISNKNNWPLYFASGDYERIFRSRKFIECNMFEDAPWFMGDMYKMLFFRFPNSKFILFERDADAWYSSMMKHSSGKNLGNTHAHSMIYNRLGEFHQFENYEELSYIGKVDKLMDMTEDNRKSYTDIYKTRNTEVRAFFKKFGEDRLFFRPLEDENKWHDLGKWCGINVDSNYDVHLNQSKDLEK